MCCGYCCLHRRFAWDLAVVDVVQKMNQKVALALLIKKKTKHQNAAIQSFR